MALSDVAVVSAIRPAVRLLLESCDPLARQLAQDIERATGNGAGAFAFSSYFSPSGPSIGQK